MAEFMVTRTVYDETMNFIQLFLNLFDFCWGLGRQWELSQVARGRRRAKNEHFKTFSIFKFRFLLIFNDFSGVWGDGAGEGNFTKDS